MWLAGHGFDAPTLDAFRELRFTGDVWAIPEGHVVFPAEAGLPGRPRSRRRAGHPVRPPPQRYSPLLIQVMRSGERTAPSEPVAVAADRLSTDLAGLPTASRELRTPTAVEVQVSERLEALTRDVREAHRPAGPVPVWADG